MKIMKYLLRIFSFKDGAKLLIQNTLHLFTCHLLQKKKNSSKSNYSQSGPITALTLIQPQSIKCKENMGNLRDENKPITKANKDKDQFQKYYKFDFLN